MVAKDNQNLSRFSMKELRDLAKNYGIENYNSKGRSELLYELEEEY